MTPEEARQRSSLEQAATDAARIVPSVCWNLYVNLKEEGFTEAQAFSLAVAYVLATFSGGIKPQ